MYRKLYFILASLYIGLPSCLNIRADEIKIPQQAQIALADGSVAQATFVAIPQQQLMMIVQLQDGHAAIFYLSKNVNPINPVNPVDPEPVPQRLTIAIVENPADVTPQQARVIQSRTFTEEAKRKHNFLGIVTPDAKDAKTNEVPAQLAPFLSEAKLHDLPWIIFTNAAGTIVWQGAPPATAAELIATLHKFGGK